MKFNFKLASFISLAGSVVFLSNAAPVMAKELQLYEQPKADAKVVAKVDPASGIIPIYSPGEGQWVKIADPKNGNVGWVKSSDLNNAHSIRTSLRFSQGTVNEGRQPVTYQLIQFGEPGQLTSAQAEAIVKKMRLQQQAMHQSMQRMMHEMNHFFDDQWSMMDKEIFPVIMPVMVYPDHKPMKPSQTNPGKPQQKVTSTVPANQAKPAANPTENIKKQS